VEEVKEVERGNGLEENLLSQGAGEVKIKWKGTQLNVNTYYSQKLML